MNEGSQPTGGAVRVGDFVLDPRSGELRNGGSRHVLSAQPLHVLLALAEHPGELVTRDELRARLWPADTFVDFEHGLNAVVKRLRDALGDSTDIPRYIETVPRRGYRLIAPVRADGATADPDPAASPVAIAPAVADTNTRRPLWRRPAFVAGAIAAAALSIAGVRQVLQQATPGAAARVPSAKTPANPVRLTFGPGLQTDATWSPDGRRIAFAWDRDGNFDLFVQSLDGGEPVAITNTPANEEQPAWSPDGERLAFRSDADGGGLFTIGVKGGPSRRIANQGSRPAWMPGGQDVVFAEFAGSVFQTLYVVRADGGEPPRRILREPMAGGSWASFTIRSDGRILLAGFHPTLRLGYFLSDRSYRELKPTMPGGLPPGWQGIWRAQWNAAGDALFVEAVVDGLWSIWRVPVDPANETWGLPIRLTSGPAWGISPAVSPDGSRLAFTSGHSAIRAWTFPFDANRASPPGEGRPVTDEDAWVGNLALSADGSTLGYLEDRPGQPHTNGIRRILSTGESTVLSNASVSPFIPSVDGRRGAYLLGRVPGQTLDDGDDFTLAWRDENGSEHLLAPWGHAPLVPTDVRRDDRAVLGTSALSPSFSGPTRLVEWPIGPSPSSEPSRVLLEASKKAFWQGRYSPDGRWVAFVVSDLSGENLPLELGIAPADSTGASTWVRVAADQAWPDKPRWSPDGRTLYFLSRAASGLLDVWAVRMDPSRGAQVGRPFRLTSFDSSRWHVNPNTEYCEMGVAKGRLVLPMETVRGSIWLLSNVGT